MGPFQVMSTGPSTYYLELLPCIAAFHLWFHASPLKSIGPQPGRWPVMEDDSYEVEAILLINKHSIRAKVK